ncbi:interleukin-17F-like [Lates japonicus]|uniref:Interleukin-17F-like protein n=1 Tax=Lates japonicus TaxID=270547 RepID=A0AAD3MSG4_LATJO|nr:interleukin-17F-like protein [Lates japonicus]
MLLLSRALLMLGLATLLHATRKEQAISVKFGRRTGLKGRKVRLVLDPSVQPQIASTSPSSIANMSLSPWMYRDSYMASRFPSRISHAQCLTSSCLSLRGEGEDAALEAKPIYYQVLVLYRVPKQQQNNKGGRKARNKYVFRLRTEVIPVGCTCVRPSVIPQQ